MNHRSYATTREHILRTIDEWLNITRTNLAHVADTGVEGSGWFWPLEHLRSEKIQQHMTQGQRAEYEELLVLVAMARGLR